jgi:hypothetical protein
MPAWLKFFDAYTIRARVFPAIIAAIPALAMVILLVSWSGLALSSGIAAIGLLIILYMFSDFARSQGRKIEPRIYELQGGKPSVTRCVVLILHWTPTRRTDIAPFSPAS